jgi:hypothetical protein
VSITGEDQSFDLEPSSVIAQWHQYCVRVMPVALTVRQQLATTAHETAICSNRLIHDFTGTEKT